MTGPAATCLDPCAAQSRRPVGQVGGDPHSSRTARIALRRQLGRPRTVMVRGRRLGGYLRCVASSSERATSSVVPTQRVAVLALLVGALVELRGGLDLVLGPVYVDLLVGHVDTTDHPSGKHDLLAEDPWASVNDDVAGSDLIRGVVDLADVTVGGFNLVARDIHRGPVTVPVGPEICVSHQVLLSTRTPGHRPIPL